MSSRTATAKIARLILCSYLALTCAVAPGRTEARSEVRIAIMVGPVGEQLTPVYLDLAEQAAEAAERSGATVARAYSPEATPERVLAAVDGADIVIYFGHGTGFPNPYSEILHPDRVNGWSLQGPRAHGTHEDRLADGTLATYGEAWLAEHARPAPGFVMIYSNVCYAAGAGEPGQPPSTPDQAVARAANYARMPLAMGASAVIATDFYAGAAGIVDRLLSHPEQSYAELIAGDPNYRPASVSTHPHPAEEGSELWLQRSPYFAGKTDSWFAFSGDPAATFADRGGSSLSQASRFAEPRDAQVAAGRYLAVQRDTAGSISAERSVTFAAPTSLTVRQRAPMPDRSGMWLEVSSGRLAGWWLPESAAIHLPGIGARATFEPRRLVTLDSGTHAGYRFGADGTVASAAVVTLTEPTEVLADAQALIDGQPYLHLVDGPLADRWVLNTPALRLGGPQAVPPPADEVAAPTPSPSRQPSLSQPPPPPAEPPPPPAAPAPTEGPTPPRPSPTPASSATPRPTVTASSSPSASVSPSPSPTPSPTQTPAGTVSAAATATPLPS